jgi:acetolactate decarboxylase
MRRSSFHSHQNKGRASGLFLALCSVWSERIQMNRSLFAAGCLLLAACSTSIAPASNDGRVDFAGSQKTLFETGKADAVTTVGAVAQGPHSYGVGAVAGLDGEVTIFDGRPLVTRMRGTGYTLDAGGEHGMAFGVWTHQAHWRSEPIPAEVRGYLDLQVFVKAQAIAAGLDVTKPFAFLVSGTPTEVKWHVNVDRTEGKPINAELYSRSKENFVAKGQEMNIVGFHSENHHGVFISAFSPAIPKDSAMKNAIHLHLVTIDGKSAGHIDNLTLAPGMTLRLPAQ